MNIAKIVLVYDNGTQKEYPTPVARVLAPLIVNADKLLTHWDYPAQLVFKFSYDPASGNLRPSVELNSC